MYLKLALCVFLLIGMQLCVAYPERLSPTTVAKDVATKPKPVLPDDEEDGLGNRFGIRSGTCPTGYIKAGNVKKNCSYFGTIFKYIDSSGTYKNHENPLILTPYIERGEVEKARSLSKNDPTVYKNIKSYSGFINVNETEDWNLFFWYFPNKRQISDQTPWIVWLQGGPGMSSLYGLFREIGPLTINNGKVGMMPVTWASDYSLLFIDNPAGSGFSFSRRKRYPNNQDEIGKSLLIFMQQFVQVFPELKEAPLFIAGEEYGGKYVVGMAHYIHHDEMFSSTINLKGLIIGDGWIDPPNLLHYSKWALQLGLVDHQQAVKIKEAEDMARMYWEQQNTYDYAGKAKMAYNMLKIFAPFDDLNYLKDDTEHWDQEIIKFLNQDKVKKLPHDNFCIGSASTSENLVLFCGQLDMLMAYALLVESYRNLDWSGHEAYLKASREPIFGRDHTVNGYIKMAGNFMEIMVRGAGQHVPADNPIVAKQAIDIFIEKNTND
ncbi:putative serine carboxypeptidase CPVL [Papilio machaon]|uniref:Putative serine carboxypeptidase CPVL n=1 Tax=Papilio machaon TaxID=76193 RepID=A0A194RQF7_PAPMA|nr:putative serine carboxypeptidase CPVL [Papilio machaon]